MDVLAQAKLVVNGISVPVGQKLTVVPGDTVRVIMTVDYRGPAIEDGAIWTAIGWDTGFPLGFIEWVNSRTPVSFDQSTNFVSYEITCDVPILDPAWFQAEFALYGNVLDMYAKIMEVPGDDIFTPTYQNIIEVWIVGQFQNFAVTSYEKV